MEQQAITTPAWYCYQEIMTELMMVVLLLKTMVKFALVKLKWALDGGYYKDVAEAQPVLTRDERSNLTTDRILM